MNLDATLNLDSLLETYRAQGYVVVPGLLDRADVQLLRQVTDAVSARAYGLSEETPEFDFEPHHRPEAPQIQRIKKPHRIDPYYFELARHPAILAFLQKVIGPDIRLNHSKMNMKASKEGSPLEWHQDWAFAPHTNMSTCVASVMVDACSDENGALQVIAGSHQGPLRDHHAADGYFEGAIMPTEQDLTRAAVLAGPPGTVAFHHPMAIHGSGANRSGDPRRILFLEYAASDAYPLFYNVDWDEYNGRIVQGRATSEVRVEPNPIRLPQPTRAGSSIYKIQANAAARYFAA
jgi:ectoine hydroxylase-related dioxygenase (phytanoyl-CoA dioxygenase family)